jgi:hypothetical protein
VRYGKRRDGVSRQPVVSPGNEHACARRRSLDGCRSLDRCAFANPCSQRNAHAAHRNPCRSDRDCHA